MTKDIACHPAGKCLILKLMPLKIGVYVGKRLVNRVNKIGTHALDFGLRQGRWTIFKVRPFCFDFGRETGQPQFLDQYLDARLIHIVTTPKSVVDAEYCFEISEKVLTWQVFADDVTEDWRAAQSASNENAKGNCADFARYAFRIVHRMHTDVMEKRTGAVFDGTVDRDLELARQIGKFRMKR